MFNEGGGIEYWTRKVQTISADDSVRNAARRMDEMQISSLVIAELDRPTDIITERDIVRAVSEGMDPEATKVGDLMTRDPVTIRITEEPLTTMRIMLGHGFRHIPVVDDNEKLVGIVSLRDLIRLQVIDSVR